MAVFKATFWRLISGTLGIICLSLMATLGILLKNSFTKLSIESAFTPGPNIELQKVGTGFLHVGQPGLEFSTSSDLPTSASQSSGITDSDCCSCQEKWIGYRCNCYFISSESKSWNESRHLCAAQKSSLLQLQSRDELDFMSSSQQFYWIGLSYSEEQNAWLWESGSVLSQDLFPLFETSNRKNCIAYNPKGNAVDEPCEIKNRFICKQQVI
ncbi:natural killer cells antigen CD94 isoform X2 [Aotus nancymaae]|uniref:natural killer cells antigen CD94 isoform X2 n=1 Tax=Aotus nancymaae TaxID=37293 RepID=UPI0030FEF112